MTKTNCEKSSQHLSTKQAVALLRKWRKLQKLAKEEAALILELIAHPGATDAQLLQGAKQYRATCRQLREAQVLIADRLRNDGHSMLANYVEK